MPTFIHGKSAQILLNEYDVSSFLNEIAPSGSMDMADVTTFGNNDHVMAPGLGDGGFDAMGFFSLSVSPNIFLEQIFAALEGIALVPIISGAPEGFAIGKRVYMVQGHEVKHELNQKVDAFIVNKASFRANDGFDFGISLHDQTAAEVSSTNSASVDNLAATNNGGVGFLHVTGTFGSSPTLTVKIQHSTDNSAWVDLITFTALTAITKERIVIAPGTQVRRYLRATSAIGGGSPQLFFNASFARRLP